MECTAMKKKGRPKIAITEAQLHQIEALAGFLRADEIADYLGICRSAFFEIKSKDNEVASAYNRGRAKAFAGVGQGILKRALDGDNTAAIFYAKTQMRWREKGDNEESQAPPTDPRFSDD
jgi:hypothetical protein